MVCLTHIHRASRYSLYVELFSRIILYSATRCFVVDVHRFRLPSAWAPSGCTAITIQEHNDVGWSARAIVASAVFVSFFLFCQHVMNYIKLHGIVHANAAIRSRIQLRFIRVGLKRNHSFRQVSMCGVLIGRVILGHSCSLDSKGFFVPPWNRWYV